MQTSVPVYATWLLTIPHPLLPLGATTGRGILVGYAGKEIYFGKYDILCGDQNSVKWIDMSSPLGDDYGSLNLVEGGKDGEGNPLFVAQVSFEGAVVPGK
jgi:hypothetical protein